MGIDEVMRNKDINPLKWSNDIQNNFKVIDPCQAGKNYRKYKITYTDFFSVN